MARAQIAAIRIENSAQKPKRHGLIKTLRTNFHWKCLASTFLIQVCVAYCVWCQIKFLFYELAKDPGYIHGPCANAYKFVPLGFAALLYLIYLCECWHNRGKWDGIPQLTVGQFLDHVERMRSSSPIVWWKSICYHYLRRTKHVTRYRNGDAVTATQVYYERVNSHTSGNIFMYDHCGVKDISKDIYDMDDFSVVRVRFTKGFVFACVQAANEFEDQRTRFFNENESRDDYMEVREGLDFADCRYIDHALVFANDKKLLPFYMRSGFYWSACVLLMGWPLRLFIDWRMSHVQYQVTKLFGTNYLSPSSINYTGPLTRTSTIDSAELALANRENYLIVPSYSEAILLDPLHPNHQIRSEIRFRNLPLSACNETTIVPNYGAIGEMRDEDEDDFDVEMQLPPPVFRMSSLRSPLRRQNLGFSRSRSMSFSLKSPQNYVISMQNTPPQSTAAHPLPRPSQLLNQNNNLSPGAPPPRSISIAGAICEHQRAESASVTPIEFDDRRPLMESFRRQIMPPPINEPPPPYEVALRMFNPIYTRIRQSANSITSLLSRSNSKDLRHYSMDGPGS